jgi:hypothetical protein
MSGKSKKADKGLEIDFILEFEGPPERRTIKSVILQSEPHHTPETIKAHLAVFNGEALTPAIASPAGSSSSILLSEAIGAFIREKLPLAVRTVKKTLNA